MMCKMGKAAPMARDITIFNKRNRTEPSEYEYAAAKLLEHSELQAILHLLDDWKCDRINNNQ